MIDATILLCIAVCEVSLLVGYSIALWEQFITSSRLAVLAMLELLR